MYGYSDPISLFLRDWHNFIWCLDLSLPLCRWCRGPLPPRCTAYCSAACETAFTSNHFWTQAAWVCRKRYDDKCADCGTVGSNEIRHNTRAVDPSDPRGPRVWDPHKHGENNRLEAHHMRPPIYVPRDGIPPAGLENSVSLSCWIHFPTNSNLVAASLQHNGPAGLAAGIVYLIKQIADLKATYESDDEVQTWKQG